MLDFKCFPSLHFNTITTYFLLKLFQLWLLGAFSSWRLCPFHSRSGLLFLSASFLSGKMLLTHIILAQCLESAISPKILGSFLLDNDIAIVVFFLQIKFYWSTVTLIHFHIIYGCFCITVAELNSCKRMYGLQSLKHLLSSRFADPFSKQKWWLYLFL